MSARLEQMKQEFLSTGDGVSAIRERSDAVDEAVTRLFEENFGGSAASGVAIAAVGGYGRRQLFPCSDVDLLFLFERQSAATAAREPISAFLGEMWDGGLRASHSVRTPSECTSLAADNTELHISLLDLRHLAGDRILSERLADRLPSFYARERDTLLRQLAALARARHARYGNTIYHLEPNIKDSPGGLRDFQLACWLVQLTQPEIRPEHGLPDDVRDELLEAKRFLFALRCYLHYFNGRDNNILTFEHQERVAAEAGGSADPAAWMRDYFRNARLIHRMAARTLDETATPQHSLFSLFRDRQSRLSNVDFAVTRGLLYVRRPEALESEPALVLRLFEFIARHGVPAAPETERRLARAVPAFRVQLEQARRVELSLWPTVSSILRLPQAYRALVTMRETGLLAALFPEFRPIDCLVVRDFYHRYTVDEHSLRTLKTLQELGQSDDPLTRRFAELLGETEQPEVLLFALLFHDVGKGTRLDDHVSASLEQAEGAMERLQMGEPDREMARFLIRHHLDMSATMTSRDLADPATVKTLAERVSTLEQLRKLTLLTYADIASVNPDALTPWRKDLLWQLYVATHNQLTREMEADRITSTDAVLDRLAFAGVPREAVARFLDGVPTRYLRIHSPDQILAHFRLEDAYRRKSVAVGLTRRHSVYELVVLASDRPFLLASIAGTLSSLAMNILKAEAFSNSSGMILDTFVFSDPARTLELNPQEADRLTATLERVVVGKLDVRDLLRKRPAPSGLRRAQVLNQISFDNSSSEHDTVFHVIAEDRPGLLYDLASTFSFNSCDIDVVLIDTEGYKAIDVFYVSCGDQKLPVEKAQQLCTELEMACRGVES